MSAIRTPRHSTKKRIVVNIETGQTVNVAKRWGVFRLTAKLTQPILEGRYYYHSSALQAVKYGMEWVTAMENRPFKPWEKSELVIRQIDYSHIIDDEQCTHNNWIDVTDTNQPHKAARELKELLAQL